MKNRIGCSLAQHRFPIRCVSFFWLDLLGALRWCHRGVGRSTEESVGFPEWTAQFSVWKTTGKDSSHACAIACQNCAVYSVFSSGMTSHSKIAQFNWECIAPLIMETQFQVYHRHAGPQISVVVVTEQSSQQGTAAVQKAWLGFNAPSAHINPMVAEEVSDEEQSSEGR